MGFFGKLTQNFKHGGVSVRMQAPASVSMQDASLAVQVIVTAKDAAVTINKVSAEIIRESSNQSFNSGSTTTNTGPTMETVARAESTEMFSLASGESRTVELSILMNAGATLAENLPEGSGMAQLAGTLQKMESVANALNQNSYTYRLIGKADVDGIALDPTDSQPLQVLKPGQIGAALNIKL